MNDYADEDQINVDQFRGVSVRVSAIGGAARLAGVKTSTCPATQMSITPGQGDRHISQHGFWLGSLATPTLRYRLGHSPLLGTSGIGCCELDCRGKALQFSVTQTFRHWTDVLCAFRPNSLLIALLLQSCC